MGIHEPDFTATYRSVAVFQVAPALPHGFNFGAGEDNPAFVRFEYKVVVVSLSIGRHHFFITHSTIMMAPPNPIFARRTGLASAKYI